MPVALETSIHVIDPQPEKSLTYYKYSIWSALLGKRLEYLGDFHGTDSLSLQFQVIVLDSINIEKPYPFQKQIKVRFKGNLLVGLEGNMCRGRDSSKFGSSFKEYDIYHPVSAGDTLNFFSKVSFSEIGSYEVFGMAMIIGGGGATQNNVSQLHIQIHSDKISVYRQNPIWLKGIYRKYTVEFFNLRNSLVFTSILLLLTAAAIIINYGLKNSKKIK